jgi:WD40 repeat protein
VNEHVFASASTDGVIILWDVMTLQVKRKLNDVAPLLANPEPSSPTSIIKSKSAQPSPNSPKSTINRKVFNFTVINDRYLGVAIGKGFRIYDIETGDTILFHDDAHRASVNKIIPLHRGSVIVTCSDDSEIKIWNSHRQLRRSKKSLMTPSSVTPQSKRNSMKLFTTAEIIGVNETMQATLIGEMALHTKAIQDIVPLSYHSFASCGADMMILVWKDSRMERRLRSFYAMQHLQASNQTNVNQYVSPPQKLPRVQSQPSPMRRIIINDMEGGETDH